MSDKGGKTLVGNHRGQTFLVVGDQVCTHLRRDFVPLLFADPLQVIKVLRLTFGNLNLQLPPWSCSPFQPFVHLQSCPGHPWTALPRQQHNVGPDLAHMWPCEIHAGQMWAGFGPTLLCCLGSALAMVESLEFD